MINIYIYIAMALVLGVMAFGFYMFLVDALHLPSLKVKKNTIKLTSSIKNRVNVSDIIINKIAMQFAKIIKLNPIKRAKLENEFQTLGVMVSPEMYYATAITKGLLVLAVAIIAFFLSAIFGVLIAILALLVFLLELSKVDKMLQKYRRAIEGELPRFVAVIMQTFKYNVNVRKMIEDYVGDNDTPLCNGLRIVLADMQTGNAEIALSRFSNRVNSLFLNETMRGLMSAIRGDDVISYFEMLSIKIWEAEKIRVEKEYMKTPNKVKYLIFGLMACMALIYITVFATVLMNGLTGIMGVL